MTEGDAVSFVETLRTKLMEAPILPAQATANDKPQFMNSPNLQEELTQAIIGAMSAHHAMSKEALNSDAIQARLLTLLLGPGELWEGLRRQESASPAA